MTFIGIDVGITGGLAALDDAGKLVAVREMPTREGANGKPDYDICAIYRWLNHAVRRHNQTMDALIAVERQQVMRGDGGVSGGSIMMGYGIIRGVVELFSVEGHFKYVSPQTWMSVCLKNVIEICEKCGAEMVGIKPLKETPEQKARREKRRLPEPRRGRYCPMCYRPMPQKGRSFEACAALFPGVNIMRRESERHKWKPHTGIADSLLIAHWCWKTAASW